MNRRILLFLAVFLLLGTVSHAEPEVTTETNYYDIQGRTVEELRNQMRQKSHHSDGFAHTDWNIRWNYVSESVSGGYRISDLHVTMSVLYNYPRWTDEGSAPWGVQGQWKKFMKALEAHEKGHGEIAMQAVHAVEKSLASLPPVADGRQLNWKAQAAAQQTLSEYQRKEIDYDRTTEHGMKRGAVL